MNLLSSAILLSQLTSNASAEATPSTYQNSNPEVQISYNPRNNNASIASSTKLNPEFTNGLMKLIEEKSCRGNYGPEIPHAKERGTQKRLLKVEKDRNGNYELTIADQLTAMVSSAVWTSFSGTFEGYNCQDMENLFDIAYQMPAKKTGSNELKFRLFHNHQTNEDYNTVVSSLGNNWEINKDIYGFDKSSQGYVGFKVDLGIIIEDPISGNKTIPYQALKKVNHEEMLKGFRNALVQEKVINSRTLFPKLYNQNK